MFKRFKSKNKTWIPFAKAVGGEFVKSRYFGVGSIELTHNKINVKVSVQLDENGGRMTSVSSILNSLFLERHPTFFLSKSWPMQFLAKAFFNVIPTGNKPLENLGIKGDGFYLASHPALAESLFATKDARLTVDRLPRVSVAIGNDRLFWRKNNLELKVSVPHFVADETEFLNLVRLQTLLLDALSQGNQCFAS